MANYVKTIFMNSYMNLCKGTRPKTDHSVFHDLVKDAITAARVKNDMIKKFEEEKKAVEENRSMFRMFG